MRCEEQTLTFDMNHLDSSRHIDLLCHYEELTQMISEKRQCHSLTTWLGNHIAHS